MECAAAKARPLDWLTGAIVSVPVPMMTLMYDPYNLLFLLVRNVVSSC